MRMATSRGTTSFGSGKATAAAFNVARELRGEGFRVEMEQAGRSMKGQLRQADRVGAGAVVIFDDAIEVKDMNSGEQSPVRDADEAIERVRELLG